MSAQLYFVVETGDGDAARSAFVAALALAMQRLNVADLMPAAWQPLVELPGDRLSYLLARFLTTGAVVRLDLDSLPILDGDDDDALATIAWGVNLEISSSDGSDLAESTLAASLSAWWRTAPAVSRGLSRGNQRRHTGAVAPSVHDQVVTGTGAGLLVALDDAGTLLALDDAGTTVTFTPSVVNVAVRLLEGPPAFPRQVFA